MRILIAQECSGMVRRAFTAAGHDAISVDIKPDEGGEQKRHIVGDVTEVLTDSFCSEFDMMIGFPDCTYLCASGMHWIYRETGRLDKLEAALAHFNWLFWRPVKRICLENPKGFLSKGIRKPDQYFQPYMFGDDASKETGLWLYRLPPLPIPPESEWYPPRYVDGLPRWSNQTDSGQNRLPPSDDRATDRARFYPGPAAAMVKTWGNLTTEN